MTDVKISERQSGDVTVLVLGGKITIGEGNVSLRGAIRRLAEGGRRRSS